MGATYQLVQTTARISRALWCSTSGDSFLLEANGRSRRAKRWVGTVTTCPTDFCKRGEATGRSEGGSRRTVTGLYNCSLGLIPSGYHFQQFLLSGWCPRNHGFGILRCPVPTKNCRCQQPSNSLCLMFVEIPFTCSLTCTCCTWKSSFTLVAMTFFQWADTSGTRL